MTARAFRIHPADNVATMLSDAAAGVAIAVAGPGDLAPVAAAEAIAMGHKVALAPLRAGDAVVKFGVAVAEASRPIAAGDWVHLHNSRSRYDARSGDFDLETGVAKDTAYG